MDKVYILTDGRPVKLTADFSSTEISIEGFLTEFVYKTKKYRFYRTIDLREEDRQRSSLYDYCEEAVFLQYIQYSGSAMPTSEDVKRTKFPFESFTAQAGDPVEVEVLDFGPPWNYYYKRKKVSFNVENDPQTHSIKFYNKNNRIPIPQNAVTVQDNFDCNSTARGNFYDKNYGSLAYFWDISDEEKEKFTEVMTLICFKIYFIERDIFSNILTGAEMNAVNAAANNSNPNDMSGLSDLQQVVFSLKKSWGYFYVPNSNLPHRQSFDAVLPDVPNYEINLQYLNGLENFYAQTYVIQNLLLTTPPEERLKYLLEILPVAGISAIPIVLRLKVLKDILRDDIPESKENFALRIIYSFTDFEANQLLDFLLTCENGGDSNFHIIYRKMDDKRLSRYPFVSWFVSEASNRKYFTYAIYKLWKVSKYNAVYVPAGVTPNIDGLNPNAFFLNEGSIYYKDDTESILTFSPRTTNPGKGGYNGYTSIKSTYRSDIENILIKVREEITKGTLTYTPVGEAWVEITDTKPFSDYHLYQAIALVNYLPDSEIEMPQELLIPAFLFHYVEEFDRLKDFDAAMSLGIEITTELILFFFTGGASIIKDLRYLKYITKIGRVISEVESAVTTVQVWRGLEAGAQIVTLTGSMLVSTTNYMKTILDNHDDPRYAIYEQLNKFFLYLTFASAASSIYARVKAANAADVVLNKLASYNGPPHNLSQEVIDVLNAVKNSRDVTISLFQNKLGALGLAEDNRILTRFNLFSPTEKLSFFKAFNKFEATTDIEVWKDLNKEYFKVVNSQNISYTLVDIWKEEITKLKLFRDDIDFLKNVNRLKYLKYHEIRHLRELVSGSKGAHLAVFITDDLNSNVLWKTFFTDATASTNIQMEMRTFVFNVNGHTLYENLWRFNPNTTEYLINGLGVSRKRFHFVINPQWSEQDLIEEMAYAWANRKQVRMNMQPARYGRPNPVIRTQYRSRFSDGTKVEFEHSNYQFDPVTQDVVDDHIGVMKIVNIY
jgi:hypothetical protein